MFVDFLRSCHSSVWRFYKKNPATLTRGRFYFAPQGTPPLPFLHNFYSATWTDGDEQPPNRLGPLQDAPRPWSPGKLAVGFPPAVSYGTAEQFQGELRFPEDVNESVLRDGVPTQCWIHAGAPFLPTDAVFDIASCCLRAAYFRLIDLQYGGDFNTITDFFHAWLGAGVTVRNYPGEGLFPAMTIVQTSDYWIVISSGTANFQQLATQAWQSGLGPSNMGRWSTLPLWMDASQMVADRMYALGGNSQAPVLFVGHSYGAALCAITAVRCRDANATRRLRILTAGLPKPGDTRFNDTLDQIESLFVMNSGDVIPQLPISAQQTIWYSGLVPPIIGSLWAEWVRPGNALLYAEDGTTTQGPPPSLTFDVLLPLVVTWSLGLPMPVISAHNITTYIDRHLIRCACPNWPLDAESWRILFGRAAEAFGLGGGAKPAATALGFDARPPAQGMIGFGWSPGSAASADVGLGEAGPAAGDVGLGEAGPAAGVIGLAEAVPAAGVVGLGTTEYPSAELGLSGVVEHGELTVDDPGDGEWIVPDGVFSIIAIAQGGGGGGEDVVTSDANTGGGGGGGACVVLPMTVIPGTSIPYHVGAGGAHGSPGNDGESSWISTTDLMEAGGGFGGGSPGQGTGGPAGIPIGDIGATLQWGGVGGNGMANVDTQGGGNGAGSAGTDGAGGNGDDAQTIPNGSGGSAGIGDPAGGTGGQYGGAMPGVGGGGMGSTNPDSGGFEPAQDGASGRVVIRW
jgi:hypothetical protein